MHTFKPPYFLRDDIAKAKYPKVSRGLESDVLWREGVVVGVEHALVIENKS
jgi:hypothetical protein